MASNELSFDGGVGTAIRFGAAFAIVYFGATLAYRHRTTGTSWSPAVSRTDVGSRG